MKEYKLDLLEESSIHYLKKLNHFIVAMQSEIGFISEKNLKVDYEDTIKNYISNYIEFQLAKLKIIELLDLTDIDISNVLIDFINNQILIED